MTSTTQPRTVVRTTSPSDRQRWLTLALMMVGQFMALVDVTIVNVALPTMQSDLHASGAALQLVVSGYTISYAMLLITGARLGDMRGPKPLFQLGLLTFTTSSLICGISPNVGLLIAARFVQGAGAAAMVPQLFSVIQRQFTGPARLRALGLYTATLALGSAVGQVGGGLLVTSNLFGLTWRSVFLVNVPIGAVLAVLIPRYVTQTPDDVAASQRRLDLQGLAVVASSVLLIVLPLVLGHEEGWPAWTWVSLIVGVLGLVWFVRVERRVAARGGHPLLNLDVLQARGMPAALVALTVGMVGYGGFLFSLALHLQDGLGDSALRAGLTLLPAVGVFGLIGMYWRRLSDRWHHLLPVVGYAIALVGYLALADYLRADQAGVQLYLLIGVVGAGLGMAFSPILTLAMVHVQPHAAPDASGLLTTTMQLSQVVGVAVFGSLFLSVAAHHHAHASAHAVATTFAFVGVLTALGVAGALQLARVVQRARTAAPTPTAS
ncbi:MAG TPA: MFS transporter [Acidothermaceae bacterium]|nr:MFS transporter [Acidothermaceae bacterium]